MTLTCPGKPGCEMGGWEWCHGSGNSASCKYLQSATCLSRNSQVGTVLAKQAQGVPAPVALPPSQAVLLTLFLAQVEAQLERWSDLLGLLLFKCPSSVVCAVIALITSLSSRALSFLWVALLSHAWGMDFSAGLLLPKISVSVHISHFGQFYRARLTFYKTSHGSSCWADTEHSALLCFPHERFSVWDIL